MAKILLVGDSPAKVRITHARRSLSYYIKTFFKDIKMSSSQEITIDKLKGMKEAHKRNYGKRRKDGRFGR